MSERGPEVIVAGAGPVGLFTALALARRGLEVEVLDEQWRTASRSYALALHPESLRLLDELGLLGEVAARAHRLDSVLLRDGMKERLRLELSRLEAPFPYLLVIPQRELEAVLEKALHELGVPVRWNHRLAEIEPREDGVQVLIERLGKDSTGYGVATTSWVVDKVFPRRAAFLVGADGHRSTVRRIAGIPFHEVGGSQIFGVFELSTEEPPGHELTVVLDQETTNALWPMGDHRFRWTFELFEQEIAPEVRRKERVHTLKWADESLTVEQRLDQLVAQRAPWFGAASSQIVWSSAIHFERKTAGSLVAGRLMVVGDAAHLASPVGVQSMNLGLREGAALAQALRQVLRDGAPESELLAWESAIQSEWRQLQEIHGPPTARSGADDWARQNAGRILPCLPASGQELSQLLWQAGLVPPVAGKGSEASPGSASPR